MRRLALLLLLFANQAAAQCAGTDIRDALPPEDRAALAAAGEAVPYGTGNHWTAKKDGQTIHVIGTMHVSDPRMAGPISRLEPVIRSADRVLLEADAETQAELQSAIASRPEMLLLEGQSLIDLMPEARWQELAEAARARGIPSVMAARFQPWYLSLMLAMPPCMMAQVKEKNGLDQQIMDIAADAGVPTGALEPYDTIFRIFGSEDIETQIAMMEAGVMDPQRSEDVFATMTALYFEEETAASWELTRLTAQLPEAERDALLAEVESELLVKRNESWMPVILGRAEDKTLVVAVGAAHLQGEHGVLNLLAGSGYTLTRQPF